VGFHSGNGIPMVALTGAPTRAYSQTYADPRSFPHDRATLRADALDYAKEYRGREMAEMRTQLVTIIADGMTFAGRAVWCILGFWIDSGEKVRIPVPRVLALMSATARNLATPVAAVVTELRENRAVPIALMSDNGPNVKSAFGKGERWTVGRTAGVDLFLLSCCVHSGIWHLPMPSGTWWGSASSAAGRRGR
jgi:hypothetical protein